jgi:hypothetical protein
MHKIRTALNTRIEQDRLDRSLDKSVSNLNSHGPDQRLSRLLILLRQLMKSLPVLESISEIELIEIVYSAIHVCGFVDPAEAEFAIENVLVALEAHNLSRCQCSNWGEPLPSGITFHSDN